MCFIVFDRQRYHQLRDEWSGTDEVFNRPDIIEVRRVVQIATHVLIRGQERHRIDVDCRRTDRTQPLFITQSPAVSPSPSTSIDANGVGETKEHTRRVSTFSPNVDEVGAQAPSNHHIERLAGILLTYNFFEKELGMSCHSYVFVPNADI